MGKLEEYRRKRDFGTTPEPAGEPTPSAGGGRLSYVIQKHAASRLHYDFRIELDGVLLSWAVPKGPSLDTADKRLAMHVEDHPIEYGSFEGVIPAGEYGGGTVMLWDRGSWEPDHGDPREHLAQGHLKFYLYGERLRGRWMLVKTKGYGGKSADSWLLFKERDDEVRGKAEFDAAAEWTTSVATGRTMDEIAADIEAVWHSDASVEDNVTATHGLVGASAEEADGGYPSAIAPRVAELAGAIAAPMPHAIDVELASLVEGVPDGDRWLHEIKLDGYRMIAFLDHGAVRLVSRSGHDWTERFGTIAAGAAALGAEQAILDGEVVVLRDDGTSDFQALQNHARRGQEARLHFAVFDLLYLNGHDLRGVALEDRKRLLATLLPRHTDVLRCVDHVVGHGDTFLSHACALELEGAVSKRRDAPYRSGRGRDWVKTKCLKRQEFVVLGYTEPQGARTDFGALLLGVHDEGGQLRYAGRVGTGFTDTTLRDLGTLLREGESATPPIHPVPDDVRGLAVHWVDPKLVAEVRFAEWTAEGALRHPSFLGLREDKPAEDVVAEKATPAPAPEPAAPATAAAGSAPVVAGVRLTNPDRVFWPEASFTKLDLVRYLEAVAEPMLAQVADRPLSLVRCPSGYTGECFYQKHVENFPGSVGTVDVLEPREGTTMPYAVAKDLAGLVGLAQMGVLEIHPWGSRADEHRATRSYRLRPGSRTRGSHFERSRAPRSCCAASYAAWASSRG